MAHGTTGVWSILEGKTLGKKVPRRTHWRASYQSNTFWEGRVSLPTFGKPQVFGGKGPSLANRASLQWICHTWEVGLGSCVRWISEGMFDPVQSEPSRQCTLPAMRKNHDKASLPSAKDESRRHCYHHPLSKYNCHQHQRPSETKL